MKFIRKSAPDTWYVMFPIGFGWLLDIEVGAHDTHDEVCRRLSFTLVRPK